MNEEFRFEIAACAGPALEGCSPTPVSGWSGCGCSTATASTAGRTRPQIQTCSPICGLRALVGSRTSGARVSTPTGSISASPPKATPTPYDTRLDDELANVLMLLAETARDHDERACGLSSDPVTGQLTSREVAEETGRRERARRDYQWPQPPEIQTTPKTPAQTRRTRADQTTSTPAGPEERQKDTSVERCPEGCNDVNRVVGG
jgi:hypothetical protein